MQKIIAEGFGFVDRHKFEIEPNPSQPDENGPLRTVFTRFILSTARDKVLKVTKDTGGVQWEGSRHFFSLPGPVQGTDHEEEEVCNCKETTTQEERQAHTAFPVTLLFIWKGIKIIFKDNVEAERFLLEQGV